MTFLRWAALVLLAAAGSAVLATVVFTLTAGDWHDFGGGNNLALAPLQFAIAFVADLIFLVVFATPAALFLRRTGLPRWPYCLGVGAVVGGLAGLALGAFDDSWLYPILFSAVGALSGALWFALEAALFSAPSIPHSPSPARGEGFGAIHA